MVFHASMVVSASIFLTNGFCAIYYSMYKALRAKFMIWGEMIKIYLTFGSATGKKKNKWCWYGSCFLDGV